LAGMAHNCPTVADIRRDSGGTRHLIPETERAGPQETVVTCPQEVAADPEEILDDAVPRREAFQMGGGLDPAPLALSLPRRMSRTSPSSSTARHRYCCRSGIFTNSSSRYQVSPWGSRRCRNLRASSSPNLRHHYRIDSYVTVIPRSARRSSTSRKLRPKRWESQTA